MKKQPPEPHHPQWSPEQIAAVDRAKAILVDLYNWTEDRAYRCLQMTAHNTGLKIPDVAARVNQADGELPVARPGQERARMGFCLTWPDQESQKATPTGRRRKKNPPRRSGRA